MSLSLFDWVQPAVRNTDPDTSWAAAARNQIGRNTDRAAALLAHVAAPNGLTDFELAACMGRQQTSAGKRRGELRDLDLIEATEVRRAAPSGSPAIVWRVNERGRRVARDMAAV